MQVRAVERDALMRFKDFQGWWCHRLAWEENKGLMYFFFFFKTVIEKKPSEMWLINKLTANISGL